MGRPPAAVHAGDAWRVARNPDGEWRTWRPWDRIPEDHTHLRLATMEEAALAMVIEKHRNPPVSLGKRLGKLMDRNAAAK